MAEDKVSKESGSTRPGIATADRRVYGPRPLSALLPALTRPSFRRRSAAGAQVMTDWEMIVGPDLARSTIPKRLSAGTLTLACLGPVALELQHMADALKARINAHLGTQAVNALRFEQSVIAAPAAPPIRVTPPEVAQQAEAAVSTLPEGDLRAALASLGRAVLTHRHDANQRSTTTRAKP